MKRIFMIFTILCLTAATAFSETTVTVQNDQPGANVVVQPGATPPAVSYTVVERVERVSENRTDVDIEGEIINVDLSKGEILVRDILPRDKRILVKQGMISNYKVGDYVQIDMMADDREAKMIRKIR